MAKKWEKLVERVQSLEHAITALMWGGKPATKKTTRKKTKKKTKKKKQGK